MTHYKTNSVFTPSQQATVNFVARPAIENQLLDALETVGTQVIIYGHSGSGKSSLLRKKLHEIYPNHITVSCHTGMTWDEITLSAFDQLDQFFETEQHDSSKSQTSYGAIQGLIQRRSEQHQQMTLIRVVPPQLTPQRLAQFLGEKELCLVLEDFHKVEESQRMRLSQALKIFVDEGSNYPSTKVICVGAVGTARMVVEYDPEMRNRVAEIKVDLMTDDELGSILDTGEKLLNISFGHQIKSEIVKYSSGLATVCHQLALSICQDANIRETQHTLANLSLKQFTNAIDKYVRNASDTLSSVFDRALKRTRVVKYDNSRLILEALSNFNTDGAIYNTIFTAVKQSHPEYPASNLTSYLGQLCEANRGSILRNDPDSGMYSFSDPLFHAYARAMFQPPQTDNNLFEDEQKSISLNLEKALRELMEVINK